MRSLLRAPSSKIACLIQFGGLGKGRRLFFWPCKNSVVALVSQVRGSRQSIVSSGCFFYFKFKNGMEYIFTVKKRAHIPVR